MTLPQAAWQVTWLYACYWLEAVAESREDAATTHLFKKQKRKLWLGTGI